MCVHTNHRWSIASQTLNVMCSRKCAVPLVSALSYRLPASMKTPTVAVSPWPPCTYTTKHGSVDLQTITTCCCRAREGALPLVVATPQFREEHVSARSTLGRSHALAAFEQSEVESGISNQRTQHGNTTVFPPPTSLATRTPFLRVDTSVAGVFMRNEGRAASARRALEDIDRLLARTSCKRERRGWNARVRHRERKRVKCMEKWKRKCCNLDGEEGVLSDFSAASRAIRRHHPKAVATWVEASSYVRCEQPQLSE